MKQLDADIKNKKYHNVYALFGKQSYLRKRYCDTLVKLFVSESDTMNLSRFYGKKIDLNEVIGLAGTMPFMSDKRVIVLEDTDLLSRSCEELADFIPQIPEETVMIFSDEKIDMRLKHVKEIKSSGCIAEFKDPSDDELQNMILGKLSREHRPITKAALNLFMSRCSDDLWQISNDLEKLISFTFGKDGIREEDVDAVCGPTAEDKIFVMIDAILAGQTKKAMRSYGDLVILRTESSRVLALIREQLRLLLHIKEMTPQKLKTKEIADILGMREGRVKMALPAARKSSKIFLTTGMKMCADTEERIKTGLIAEQVGVETLIVELCNLEK